MTKRIHTSEPTLKRIQASEPTVRHLDPQAVAEALGAEPCPERMEGRSGGLLGRRGRVGLSRRPGRRSRRSGRTGSSGSDSLRHEPIRATGMRMEKVQLTTLSEAVRSFLARVRKGRGLLVEDERGKVVATVLPANGLETDEYVEASPEEREAAFKAIKRIQRKVDKSMRAQGVTEEDVVREILKDD